MAILSIIGDDYFSIPPFAELLIESLHPKIVTKLFAIPLQLFALYGNCQLLFVLMSKIKFPVKRSYINPEFVHLATLLLYLYTNYHSGSIYFYFSTSTFSYSYILHSPSNQFYLSDTNLSEMQGNGYYLSGWKSEVLETCISKTLPRCLLEFNNRSLYYKSTYFCVFQIHCLVSTAITLSNSFCTS